MYNVVKSERIHIGRFEVVLDSVEKEGEIYPYSYIKFKEAVCIIPFLDDEHILLLNEYRHPIEQWVYSFPAGMIEEWELPEEAAKRELLEETGYEAVKMESLGYFYPSYGSTTEKIYLYTTYVKKIEEPHNDALEVAEIEKVSISKLEEMIKTDKFVQGAGIAAWTKWKLMSN